MPAPDTPVWDGRGLPPVASQRLARAAASGVATSLLSAPAAAALSGCGFTPVGEVMGAIVLHIGWRGYGCGAYSGRTVTSGGGNRWAGLRPYVNALYHGWDTAVARMRAEAAALGADGVVGVRLTETVLDAGGNREFLALGTAVRGAGRTRADVPFATELAGSDLAKLLHAGWAPVGIAYGISAGVRHDDYRTRAQSRRWSGAWTNTEVEGYTELVAAVRHDARAQFQARADRLGAEVALVSAMGLAVWADEASSDHRDHYAQSMVTGTAAVRFHRGRTAPTSSLSILPLRATTTKEQTR